MVTMRTAERGIVIEKKELRVWITAVQHQTLKKYCEREELHMSHVIRIALRNYFKERNIK